jgi:mono/diheme cytochrome c family protein
MSVSPMMRLLSNVSLRRAVALSTALAISTFVGCGEPGNFEPSFRLNSQGDNVDNFLPNRAKTDEEKKDADFNLQARQYLADALVALFGTPDHPFVFAESKLDLKKIRMASGPAGGLPPSARQADLTKLKNEEAKVKAELPELEAAVKKYDSDLLIVLTKFATDNKIANVKTPADLKEQEAKFREDNKPVLDAKAAADAKLAIANGALADLNLVISSYIVPQKGLYRQHCAHCHGTTGDGAGPTAAFLTPYPRDYRQGVFKFKSTERAARPTPADLRRIIVDGINDTAMPSFALLHPDEIDSLVEYVRYLGIRGEAESAMKDRLYGDRKMMTPTRSELVKIAVKPVVDVWAEADGAVIAPKEAYKSPEDRKAWLKAGADLFAGDKAKCFSCHGTTGLGDGRKVSEPVYDIWNKDKAKAYVDLAAAKNKGEANEIERLTNITHSYNLPVQAQSPRNLRQGKYRFGRRPIDLYRRLYAGINGTEMPGGGPPTPGAKATLSDTEMWQLVDYVMSLPYDLPTHAPTAGGHSQAAAAGGHAALAEPKTEQPAGK